MKKGSGLLLYMNILFIYFDLKTAISTAVDYYKVHGGAAWC
jgi:hypothetical protein